MPLRSKLVAIAGIGSLTMTAILVVAAYALLTVQGMIEPEEARREAESFCMTVIWIMVGMDLLGFLLASGIALAVSVVINRKLSDAARRILESAAARTTTADDATAEQTRELIETAADIAAVISGKPVHHD